MHYVARCLHSFDKTMKPNDTVSLASIVLAITLGACGGGTLELGNFASITKTEGDPAFALVAPSSKSPAAFSYSSSDTSVATIAGNIVTVKLAGNSTITAAQPSLGSYSSTSKSMTLTVKPIVCSAPAVRDNGVCVPSCIAPASRVDGVCTAPASSAQVVTMSGRDFMPVTWNDTWANADAYCKTTTIRGRTAWRLASQSELSDLVDSKPIYGEGWDLGKSWTSTASIDDKNVIISNHHNTVSLLDGSIVGQSNDNTSHVACISALNTLNTP